MKKVFFNYLVIATFAVSTAFTSCKKNDDNDIDDVIMSTIVMMTNMRGGTINMAGSGTVAIDWGDGSEIDTIMLSSYISDDWLHWQNGNKYRYYHYYSYDASHSITITGEITHLSCSNSSLTGLDVSKNLALTYLACRYNQLISLELNNKLTYLDCGNNKLESLEVSKNTALAYLACWDNQLKSLDVRKNLVLTYLEVGYYSPYEDRGQLTNLDVSKNTALITLICSGNQLVNLELNNPKLTYLNCENNQLLSLNVSKCIALTSLGCSTNNLTSIDVSANPALEYLYCENNQLINLDVSKNPAIAYLNCGSNQLTNLDMSNNVALTHMYCYWNQLDTDALNHLFRTLHANNTETKHILIGFNPGADECDQSIATKKGWNF